jgi:acylphosphatase
MEQGQSPSIRKRVVYSGRVQGVGFRYSVQRLAENLPVAGFVRNLPDGTVEVVAEGLSEDVERFLSAINARMAAYITNSSATGMEPEGLRQFQVRY